MGLSIGHISTANSPEGRADSLTGADAFRLAINGGGLNRHKIRKRHTRNSEEEHSPEAVSPGARNAHVPVESPQSIPAPPHRAHHPARSAHTRNTRRRRRKSRATTELESAWF